MVIPNQADPSPDQQSKPLLATFSDDNLDRGQQMMAQLYQESEKVGKKERKQKRSLPQPFTYRLAAVKIKTIVYQGYGIGYLQADAILSPGPAYTNPNPAEKNNPKRRNRRRRNFFSIQPAEEGALLPSPLTGEDLYRKTFFVNHAAPGDLLEIEVIREKKGIAFANTVRIIESSKIRVPAPCPVFGLCGGCHLQHISYQHELAFKNDFIAELAASYTQQWQHLGYTMPQIGEILASSSRWYYRNHIQIKSNRQRQLGFFGRGHKQVVPLPEKGCLLLPRIMNEFLLAVEPEMIPPSFNLRVRQNNHDEVFIKGLSDDRPAPIYMYDIVDQINFRIKIDNFFQINRYQLEAWLDLIFSLANLKPEDSVLDIYCGVGLITLPLAKRCARVTGIEINRTSIEDAMNSAEANGLQNVRLIAGDATIVCQDEAQFDVIVVDPPRAGCDPMLLDWITKQASEKQGPRRLVYVSCNPATFFRDAGLLLARGSRLTHVQPIDMFPMTYHVELVAGFDLGPEL